MNQDPGRRLLIIDDEPAIRRLMALDLQEDGYQVFTAADGPQGLEIFRRRRPGVVLTDIKMPGMDGLEVLRRIKKSGRDCEVIVITGHGDLELAIEALRLQASDFITKPINPQALAVALERARQRLRLNQQLRSYTRELERRVQEATRQVLEAERLAAVGQSVAALVHSLKNMLSGLKGGLYLVKQGLAGGNHEHTQSGVAMLERNLERVSKLVRDLLSLSKPRRLEPVALEAAELAREVVEALAPEAAAQGVDLQAAAPPAGVMVWGEREALLDALMNLVSNAVDAASEVREGRVRLEVIPAGEEICFQVQDNGPGLDPEAEQHIFKGLFTTKGAAGTGLGLMLTHKTAREHGGRVEYQHRPGEGACFRLVLPAAPPGRWGDGTHPAELCRKEGPA